MPLKDVKIIPGHALEPERDPTNVIRRFAVDEPDLWIGIISMDPSVVTGWHHHGSSTKVVHVLGGEMTIEYGADAHSATARRGDFVVIPAGIIHRETTLGKRQVEAAVTLFGDGEGPDTVEVDSPEG